MAFERVAVTSSWGTGEPFSACERFPVFFMLSLLGERRCAND
jgi:hypothetical protein